MNFADYRQQPTACGDAAEPSQPRYASGEVPMVGDVVKFHEGNRFVKFHVGQIIEDCVKTFSMMPYRIASCTLIRRADATEPASDGEKSLSEIFSQGWLTGNPDDPQDCEDKACAAVASAATKANDAEITAISRSLRCYKDTFFDDQIELKHLRSEKAHYSVQHKQLQKILGTHDSVVELKILGTHDSVVELAKSLIAERDAALARAEAAEKEAEFAKADLSGMRSHINDILRRIGPACTREWIQDELRRAVNKKGE